MSSVLELVVVVAVHTCTFERLSIYLLTALLTESLVIGGVTGCVPRNHAPKIRELAVGLAFIAESAMDAWRRSGLPPLLVLALRLRGGALGGMPIRDCLRISDARTGGSGGATLEEVEGRRPPLAVEGRLPPLEVEGRRPSPLPPLPLLPVLGRREGCGGGASDEALSSLFRLIRLGAEPRRGPNAGAAIGGAVFVLGAASLDGGTGGNGKCLELCRFGAFLSWGVGLTCWPIIRPLAGRTAS